MLLNAFQLCYVYKAPLEYLIIVMYLYVIYMYMHRQETNKNENHLHFHERALVHTNNVGHHDVHLNAAPAIFGNTKFEFHPAS